MSDLRCPVCDEAYTKENPLMSVHRNRFAVGPALFYGCKACRAAWMGVEEMGPAQETKVGASEGGKP